MKGRDLYWIQWLISFSAGIIFFVGIFFYSIIQFNNSYIQEEKGELNVFQKQIVWAITPYLKTNDMKNLQNYGTDFIGEDVKFRVFDKNKKLLLTSDIENKTPMAEDDSRAFKKKHWWKIYRYSLKNKKIISVEETVINGDKYYIELTLLEEKVIEKIVKAQINLIVLLAVCMLCLISQILQLIYSVRSSFNKFDDSVLKIANGDLDTKLEIPRLEILEELALSVKKMTKRLKNQIVKLQLLEEYKSEFIQNASHEIKTPITAINMALELLENTEDENQKKECSKIIHFQIQAINTLVGDMLKLSEIDVEKTNDKKSFTMISLNKLVEKVIDSIACNSIKIRLTAKENININANEDLIMSAIENLLTNAIKYSGSDRIDVILSNNDNFVEIHVKDYGIGIKQEFQQKIFEKFYRIDKARSRKTGGSGLGLAIVKDIVELHKGKIKVESKENTGADFIISLPLL